MEAVRATATYSNGRIVGGTTGERGAREWARTWMQGLAAVLLLVGAGMLFLAYMSWTKTAQFASHPALPSASAASAQTSDGAANGNNPYPIGAYPVAAIPTPTPLALSSSSSGAALSPSSPTPYGNDEDGVTEESAEGDAGTSGPSELVFNLPGQGSVRVSVEPAYLENEGEAGTSGVGRWRIPDWEAGWHTNSADCGDGVTIIGGHVYWGGVDGVFSVLSSLAPGSYVQCYDAVGNEHIFLPVDFITSTTSSPVDARLWTARLPNISNYEAYLRMSGLDFAIDEGTMGFFRSLEIRPRSILLLYTCTPEYRDTEIIIVRFIEGVRQTIH